MARHLNSQLNGCESYILQVYYIFTVLLLLQFDFIINYYKYYYNQNGSVCFDVHFTSLLILLLLQFDFINYYTYYNHNGQCLTRDVHVK